MSDSLQLGQNFSVGLRSLTAPSLFAAFPPVLRQALLRRARLRKFADGQIIQQRGDEAGGFWIIERGQVKLGRFGKRGKFQMVVLMADGDSYGELAVLSGQRRVVDAVAMGEAQLQWVSDASLNSAIAQDAALARDLIGILSAQLQEVLDLLLVERRLSAPKLLVRSLLALLREKEGKPVVRISQDELAELIGVSRMTISQSLRDMERKGLLKRGYRQIEILEPDRLAVY